MLQPAARRTVRAVLALLAASFVPACGRQPAPAADAEVTTDRAVFDALEERLLRAMRGADTAALGTLWAPEYLSTSAVGHTSSRAEALMAYGAGLVRVDSAAIAEVDVRVYGRAAVVLGLLRWGGFAAGGPFSGVARFQHVWVRQADGAWQLVASQLTGQPGGPPRGRP